MKNTRNRTVRDEWLARLPESKETMFRSAEARFEACYQMLSVTLDETLSLRERGDLSRARAQTALCRALFENLASRLLEALSALESHARHFGTQPAVAPLDPANFRGDAARRASTWNSLLHHVLFAGRSRWFHKLHTLRAIVSDLATEFHIAADRLEEGSSIQPARLWESLESMHDDLNNCLRDVIVMLKCFLTALPLDQVKPFGQSLQPGEGLEPRREVIISLQRVAR